MLSKYFQSACHEKSKISKTRLTTREIFSDPPNSVHGKPAAGLFTHPPHHGGIPLGRGTVRPRPTHDKTTLLGFDESSGVMLWCDMFWIFSTNVATSNNSMLCLPPWGYLLDIDRPVDVMMRHPRKENCSSFLHCLTRGRKEDS
jgi:hypothetical protein